jgi:hypothetical protein
MPDNFIVFQLNGVDWTLSRLCYLAAGVSFLIAAVLIALVLVRYGKKRRLSGSEAASVAMHAGEVGSVDRAVGWHGHATGAEVSVSISIGDLRDAYHSQDWFKFFALPIGVVALWNSPALWFFGNYLRNRSTFELAMALMLSAPMTSACLFMWWAAIYTKLR